MNIDYLHNHKHLIPILINCLWKEWKEEYIEYTPYKNKELLQKFYENTTQNIPTAYVVITNDGNFIGTCLIDTEDMGVHPEGYPWLSSVYIKPEYRNLGYAKKLLEFVIKKYTLLHLWTFTEKLSKFYEQFGFRTVEIIKTHGKLLKNIIYMIKTN